MIILASKSASRRAMLEAAEIPFSVQISTIDERVIENNLKDASAKDIAMTLAEAKARDVSLKYPDQLVLGSDSLVVCNDRRFDKPENYNNAVEHLRFFSGNILELHSAAALVKNGEVLWSDAALAELQVAKISDTFIKTYLDSEWPEVAGCVGVFRIEGRGVQLFETIRGDNFTVLGMPLLLVQSALRKLGVLAQ